MATATIPERTPTLAKDAFGSLTNYLGWLRNGQRLSVNLVSWQDYIRLCSWRDENRTHLKFVYDHGDLNAMSPAMIHDSYSRRLHDVINELCFCNSLAYRAGGSTTFRREDLEKGLEPDECYYIQNVASITGVTDIDLAIHPPPDLAVEVDHSHSSLKKLSIYAALGIPEVWRLSDQALNFHILDSQQNYAIQESSRAFPRVKSGDVLRLIFREPDNDLTFVKSVREWVQSISQ